MGSYISMHLGSYLKLKKVTTKSQRAQSKRFCSNGHSGSKENKFCPNCGGELLTVESFIPYNEELDPFSLFEEAGISHETFCSVYDTDIEGFDIYLANYHYNPDAVSLDDERGGCNIVPISAEVMAKDLACFNSRFKKEILKIKEALGEENVEIEYGFVSYYS